MKRLFALFVIILLTACNSQKVFENYEYSYSRSGGASPTYENFLINGKKAKYFFEGNGQKYSKTVPISDEEKQALQQVITIKKLSTIQEDHKKQYDFVATTIKVKEGNFIKSDQSRIMLNHQQRWNNIIAAFENLIISKNLRK